MENSPYLSPQMNLAERIRKLNNSSRDNEESLKGNYHGTNSYPEMDKEYTRLLNQKNIKKNSAIIDLTNEELKKEYENKYRYHKKWIRFLFVISILYILNSLIELKYLKPSELNIVLIIMSFISLGLCFILIVNINAKALIDSFGYQAFYFFAIIEKIIFFFLFILKIYYFVHIIQELYLSTKCNKKFKCPDFSFLLFLFIFNCVIILLNLFCIKFSIQLFLEAVNILMKKDKTLFERQLELNLIERKEKNRKNKFVNEEKLDSNRDNSKDDMKIE